MLKTKILIMGLPGTGKTTLAKELKKKLEEAGKSVAWFNADEVRRQFNDWDFSYDGRVRQAHRMNVLARFCNTDYVICDFVAPLNIMRDMFAADYTIWMNTEESSSYADTNSIFEIPMDYNQRVTIKDFNTISDIIISDLFNDPANL